MSELYQAIKESVSAEEARGNECYASINSSDHESYAFILQEFEEADRERRMFVLDLEAFWMHCKTFAHDETEDPKDKREILATLTERAQRAACKWVRVAAMCRKATATILNRNDDM